MIPITLLPPNVRHTGPAQVTVGPSAPRSPICDTTEVNTSAAETTRTDRDIGVLTRRLQLLEQGAADPLAPRPLRDRSAAQASRLRAIIDRHQLTRPAAGALAGAT